MGSTQTETKTEPTGEVKVEEPEVKTDKETRGSKRIRELVERLKEVETKVVEPQTQDLPWNPPSYKTEEGIDPEAFESAVIQKAAAMADLKVRQVLGQRDQADAYRNSVNDFVQDLENTSRAIEEEFKDSPELQKILDSKLNALVEKANVRDGQLVPTLKASDIYGQMKEALEAARAKGQEIAAQNLSKQQEEAALRPGSSSSNQNSLSDLRQRMMKDPRGVAKELEKRLSVVED